MLLNRACTELQDVHFEAQFRLQQKLNYEWIAYMQQVRLPQRKNKQQLKSGIFLVLLPQYIIQYSFLDSVLFHCKNGANFSGIS